MKKHESALHIVSMFAAGGTDFNMNGVTGDWISLENYDSITVVVAKSAQASQTPTLRMRQATAAAGTGAKNLNDVRWWRASHASAATDSFIAAFGNTEAMTAGVDIIRAEITADQLDVANNFKFVALQVTRSGNQAGAIGAAIGILCNPRFEQGVAHQLSALA